MERWRAIKEVFLAQKDSRLDKQYQEKAVFAAIRESQK